MDPRLVERQHVSLYRDLAQMHLGANGAEASAGAHHRQGFAIEGHRSRWEGSPVDSILEHTGDRVVILRNGDQERIGGDDALLPSSLL